MKWEWIPHLGRRKWKAEKGVKKGEPRTHKHKHTHTHTHTGEGIILLTHTHTHRKDDEASENKRSKYTRRKGKIYKHRRLYSAHSLFRAPGKKNEVGTGVVSGEGKKQKAVREREREREK